MQACKGNATCIGDVAEKVHSLNKFRIYNLEWKAEYLAEQEGIAINHELLVDLVTNLELKKQDYNAAGTVAEKKESIMEAKNLWKSFADKVRTQVGT